MTINIFRLAALSWIALCICQQGFANTYSSKKINSYIYVNVFFVEAKANDTLMLDVKDVLYAALEIKHKSLFKAVADEHGYFKFKIPTASTHGYFTIVKTTTFSRDGNKDLLAITNNYFWEKGDSINVKLNYTETEAGMQSKCSFTGKGSLKYNISNQVDTLKSDPRKAVRIKPGYPPGFKGNILAFEHYDAMWDIISDRINFLDTKKNNISRIAYNVIKANMIYSGHRGTFPLVSSYGRDSLYNKDVNFQNKFKERFKYAFDRLGNYNISTQGLSNSFEYMRFIFRKIRVQSFLNTRKYTNEQAFDEISSYLLDSEKVEQSDVRECVTMLICLAPDRESNNTINFYERVKASLKNPEYISIINQLETRVPGKYLKDYNLKDFNGTMRKISDYIGKVVLIDLWFTGCGGCRAFYKNTLSKIEDQFKNNPDVVFVSICGDANESVWKKGVTEGLYTSEHATNLYTNGLGIRHPIMTDNNIWAFPCVILLNKTGTIESFNSEDLYDKTMLAGSIKKLLAGVKSPN